MQAKKINKYLLACLSVLWLLSFARMSDNSDYWIIDIFSHFPLQYALLAFVILLAGLWRRAVTLAVLAGLLLVFNLSVFVSPGKAVHASFPAARTFKVYSANLHISNDELSGLNKELQKMDPEMVLLLEVTPQHIDQIWPVIQKYPYRIEESFSGEREIGFVFLSKFPILSNNVTRLSDICKFYGVHARRPDIRGFAERRDQFLRLAADLKEQRLPVIVAGDFNSTPFSPIFRQLIAISGLRDSGVDFGWQPSWPTYVPFLWIPIDHVLLSPDVQVHNRATGSYIGSDHYPVFAELSIQN
jgi:endonuclease/exonuclease/phosphatase (EEP) superfamily protein YafD